MLPAENKNWQDGAGDLERKKLGVKESYSHLRIWKIVI